MTETTQYLNEKLNEIRRLKKFAERSLKHAPEGKLRCAMVNGSYPQYYVIRDDNRKEHPHGVYLKTSERELARKLAQKQYNQKALALLKKQERAIALLNANYHENDLRDLYESLPEARKMLVTPLISSDAQFIEEWITSHPGEQNPYPISNGFPTERGEYVRSKSEKIIADKLYYRGIPYAYEAKLVFPDNRTFFPDFTILNVRTRKTYILEHFGMIDSPEYCKNALEKLDLYKNYKIFPWDTLLLTMESSMKSLNISQIDRIIEHFLA